jgi:LysR family nitrogen assimilation transcriptional regulator
MDLRQLRYFVQVARQQSFTKAARHLNIAQPALSRHIKALETEFGVQLLERNTHQVRPTEAGLRLLEMSDFLLRYSEQMRQQVRATRDEPAGSVVIGMLPSVAFLITPTLVERVRSQYPMINLRVLEGIGAFLSEWLRLGRIDFAVMSGTQPLKGITQKLAIEEELVLTGHPENLRTFPDPMPLAALSGVPLLSTQGFRALLAPFAQAVGVQLSYEMEVDSLPIIKGMLHRRVGLSLLTYGVVHQECVDNQLDVRRISKPKMNRRLVVARADHHPNSSALIAVGLILEEEIRALPVRPCRRGYTSQA